MNRIDPLTVAMYFEANPDIRPIQNRFFEDNDDDDDRQIIGCCGSAAALMKSEEDGSCNRDYVTSELDDTDQDNACVMLGETLDLSPQYLVGFTTGWDGGSEPTFLTEQTFGVTFPAYKAGYEDGRIAWDLTREPLR